MRTYISPRMAKSIRLPPALRGVSRKFFLMFLLISLWATVTNAVPISVVFVVLSPLFVILTPKNRSLPASAFALLLLYAYFLLNTIIYAPESLMAPEFYRRDGNFFVTFLPIVICGLVAVKIDTELVLRRFVLWAGLINAACVLIYFITGGTIVYQEDGVYHFLFEAHNAAGGYLSMITAFSLGFLLQSKGLAKKLWSLVVLSNLVGLYLTASRGSIGGLLFAFCLVVILKERFIKSTILVLTVAMVVVMFYAYPFWISAGKPLELGGGGNIDGIGSKDANVLQRVLYLWPRALDLFFESPVFGTGFGSYNDIPYHISGVPHVFAFNSPTELSFNSAHAHNTYLHILGETGAVGLVLTLYMLLKMKQYIDDMEPESVRLGMKLAFWVAVSSSLTEHRLFTPAQMLPFTIIYGMALASSRWALTHRNSVPLTGTLNRHH